MFIKYFFFFSDFCCLLLSLNLFVFEVGEEGGHFFVFIHPASMELSKSTIPKRLQMKLSMFCICAYTRVTHIYNIRTGIWCICLRAFGGTQNIWSHKKKNLSYYSKICINKIYLNIQIPYVFWYGSFHGLNDFLFKSVYIEIGNVTLYYKGFSFSFFNLCNIPRFFLNLS